MNMQPWAELITVEIVRDLHREGLRRHGGAPSEPIEGCLEGSLGNAWTAQLYREPEGAKHGLCFAAHALCYLAKNHCFSDGNKRVGWLTAMESLARLGLTVRASDDEAEEMIVQFLVGDIPDVDGVISWLADRLELLTLQ
jgi:death-on-curing protein